MLHRTDQDRIQPSTGTSRLIEARARSLAGAEARARGASAGAGASEWVDGLVVRHELHGLLEGRVVVHGDDLGAIAPEPERQREVAILARKRAMERRLAEDLAVGHDVRARRGAVERDVDGGRR